LEKVLQGFLLFGVFIIKFIMNISQLKRQLKIEDTYTSEDAILQFYLDVAQPAAINFLNYFTGSTSGITGSTMPMPIQQAILILAAHLYINRTPVSFGQPYVIPYTLEWLLQPYKYFTVA
jgi:hypothetical protein